jgi:hypothetical protein
MLLAGDREQHRFPLGVTMKIGRMVCFGTILALAPLALAKLPYSNDALGRVEGTLDFCAQSDAQSASKYQERKKAITNGVPEKELAEARDSQEYRDGYDFMTTELGKVPKEKVAEACASYLKSEK